MIGEIRALDPKARAGLRRGPCRGADPDVFVRPAPDGSWLIDLNPETLPRVLMNQTYFARVSASAKSEAEKAYLGECLQNAHWLTRSLDQRARTIVKVASEIVRQAGCLLRPWRRLFEAAQSEDRRGCDRDARNRRSRGSPRTNRSAAIAACSR